MDLRRFETCLFLIALHYEYMIGLSCRVGFFTND